MHLRTMRSSCLALVVRKKVLKPMQ
jgi:hypothetical protein